MLTVEGGGVKATAVDADIGATNGIIHIIERVLEFPFKNIYDKLSSDTNFIRIGTTGKPQLEPTVDERKQNNHLFRAIKRSLGCVQNRKSG